MSETLLPGKFPGYVETEELAKIVIEGCIQFRKILPLVTELRERFRKLKDGETIAGCSGWYDFCAVKLDRTPGAVRKALAVEKPILPTVEITHINELIKKLSPLLPSAGDGEEHTLIVLIEKVCVLEYNQKDKEMRDWIIRDLNAISKNFATYAKRIAGVA